MIALNERGKFISCSLSSDLGSTVQNMLCPRSTASTKQAQNGAGSKTTQAEACRFFRRSAALTRSAVVNPSVKRPTVDTSKLAARLWRCSACHSSARLIAVRNSHDSAPWRRAVSIDRSISSSALSLPSDRSNRFPLMRSSSGVHQPARPLSPRARTSSAASPSSKVASVSSRSAHNRTCRPDQRAPSVRLQSSLVNPPESMPDEQAVLL